MHAAVSIVTRMRRSRLGIAAIAAVLLAALGTSSASAAPSGATNTSAETQAVLRQLTATYQGQDLAASSTITCTLQIQDPHQSSHKPNTWNVIATWKCTSPVAQLVLWPELYKNGELVGSPPGKSKYNTANLKHNAAAFCDPLEIYASWHGEATGYVEFPPGYEPQSDTLEVGTGSYIQGFDCNPSALR